MIELGLTRITSLLRGRPLPWKAIHVAGTNGKGSVCAYITAMLRAGGVRCGRFTSPHLLDRWDCIDIDGSPITYDAFKVHEDFLKKRNEKENIGASEFELLTACAFEAFTASNVQVGVVEVGMGGRLDATNILEKPLVTVISKIGLDHQAFLGDTIEAIAKEKAGILKPGVPCVLSRGNKPSVIATIESIAKEVGAGPILLRSKMPGISQKEKRLWAATWGRIIRPWNRFTETLLDERSQRENIACAFDAVNLALPHLSVSKPTSAKQLLPAVMFARLPGRMQYVDISELVGREQQIVLDGAHNLDSAAALSIKVCSALRSIPRDPAKLVVGLRKDEWSAGRPITWVFAFTEGKDVIEMLRELLRGHDRVVLTRFSPVDGMPWVNAMPLKDIEAAVHAVYPDVTVVDGGTVRDALQKASDLADEGLMVVAGSLYLVSDVLRLLPPTAMKTVNATMAERAKTEKVKRERRVKHYDKWDKEAKAKKARAIEARAIEARAKEARASVP